MSFDPDDDIFAPAPTRETEPNWRENPKWLAIKGISLDDCIHGRGQMEKLPPDHFTKGSKSGEKSKAGVIGFGKYKELSFKELQEKDPRYLSWAIENIKSFKEKAAKFIQVD